MTKLKAISTTKVDLTQFAAKIGQEFPFITWNCPSEGTKNSKNKNSATFWTYAYELCLGNNPAAIQFRQNEMGQHYQHYIVLRYNN